MAANNQPYVMRNPQAVAWAVVLTSFVLFCVVCALSTAGAHWFLFESQVNMTVHLTVSRGRVDMRLPDGNNVPVTTGQPINANAVFTTDNNSQGYLTFEDSYSQQVIARVFLLQESTFTLLQGSRPRFEWSGNRYEIAFANARGRFFIEIKPDLGRSIGLDIQSPLGTALFDAAGRFRLETSSQGGQLYAREGSARLQLLSGEEALVLPGMVGLVRNGTDDLQTLEVQPFLHETLNADFGSRADINTNPALPVGWACASQANKQNEPQGNVLRTLLDDQLVVQMLRTGEGLDHAESHCTYTFEFVPGIPLDVSHHASLAIRAKLRIQGQDVTTCGIFGSECPIMLELEYLGKGNTPDQPQFWRHGFYAVRPPTDENPLSCDTCLQEHEKLNLNAWYLYDSGDLFRLLPENRRPLKIIRLKVYASGHAYDAVITDLEVLAGIPDVRE